MSSYETHVTTSAIFEKPAKIIYPFARLGDVATKEIHQPLVQLADRYAPPTLGSVFSSGLANLSGSPVAIGDAYCIGDTEPQETESGLVSFVRKWSNIPATRSDYSTICYSYPSTKYNTGFGLVDNTPSRATSTSLRSYVEYFLCQAGQTYTTPAAIPLVSRQRYILIAGFETSDVDYVLSSAYPTYTTSPTAAAYAALVAAGTEIVAEESFVERYAGNIYSRTTKYVVAK
jgi:hypothetical protein